MDELIFAGNKYISSKRAGKLAGYTTDYLGQMCRADKMDCRLVGRNWYINERELEKQKKSFKKKSINSSAKEIEYSKIELEPMYYSNDERSNYPEISKVIHNDIEAPTLGEIEEEQEVPVHITRPVVDVVRHTPRPLQRQEKQVIRRQPTVSQQVHKGFPMFASIAFVFLLAGALFIAGTFTLEQVIRYSSDNNTDIETSLQLANITKAL